MNIRLFTGDQQMFTGEQPFNYYKVVKKIII